MKIDLNKFFQLDWLLIFAIILLSVLGLFAINSTTHNTVSQGYFYKQLLYVLLFIPVMIGIALTNVKFWHKYIYLLYIVALGLLVATHFMGHKSMGATRWIRFGYFNIQPSEFMKIIIILTLAKYFYTRSNNIKFYHIIISLIAIAIPFLLIFKQPDLGTSLIFLLTGVIMLFISGLAMKYFVTCGLLAVIAAPFLWLFVLYEYQKKRILIFLNPESDPLGNGYNIIQSKIAIGSGGFFGKGYLNGTQGQLNFLPEKHTDFIFTAISEEFGFIGSITTLLLYFLIFHRIITIAMATKNQFGKLSASGIAAMFMLHMIINIGMITGMLPVVGSSLPLISYGGTMTASTLIAFGFVLNADLNKKQIYQNQ
ncbi:rod shape-determining protein RodA [Flavobacteriaceae bacterium]|nr:rod shape-determining protein RodA [Flavobacteriaceae bacterium]